MLCVVEVGTEDPPYPEDIKANGWKFDLDIERLRASNTWALAAPDQRPWLLMLWVVAWDSIPVGTLPADDAVIAARLGLQVQTFRAWRDVLMRGWWRANNGLYYHRTITERVLNMLDHIDEFKRRQSEAGKASALARRAKFGTAQPRTNSEPTPNHGSNQARTGSNRPEPIPTPTPTLKPKTLASRPEDPGRSAGEVVITLRSNTGAEIPVHKGFLDELEKAYPDVDPLATLREIRAWCIANPRRCKTANGMARFLNSWFARVQNA